MALCCCWCCAGVGVLGVRSQVRVMSHEPPLVSHQSSVVSHQSPSVRNIGYKLEQIGFDRDCKFNKTAIACNLAAVREWFKSIEQGAGKCSIITLTAIDVDDPSWVHQWQVSIRLDERIDLDATCTKIFREMDSDGIFLKSPELQVL